MNFVQDYMQRSIAAIRELEKEEALEAVAKIFLEIEVEMNYLDQRRADAEERFDYWMMAMIKEKATEKHPDENFLSHDV
jgi:hypothetical protein